MPFTRIQLAIDNCERCLGSLDDANEGKIAIETYLTASLAIMIISEYERLIADLFCKRADQCGDGEVAAYLRWSMDKRFRSPDLGKINEVLGTLSRSRRDAFFKPIENTGVHAAWDNLMKARHAWVHREGSFNLTFRELKETYLQTKEVLRQLVAALGIPPSAVKGL